ncbi:terminase [Mesorhizobium sp. M4B.F.Ca.ET.017.02.2.1]|uniref:terminase n=1 Tax=Mesorhizobium sp. M4B.F.Ca.ET.017.02.2.1 TaxID=2496649 RepID=UPI000FC9C116|nr:terminase [Mesorhizobium sp. M4B.F.Ca.ET.017.02.2.1]RVD31432.1 terminase [Mesorhizobium sp. M4B.F.Ca.ET.017.02.2.1]
MTVAQTLDDILRAYQALPPEQQKDVLDKARAVRGNKVALPNPGAQTEAYFSQADELFYGGSAGGGKTYLICLLALNEHQNSLVLRRIGKNLKGIKRELQALLGTRQGFNEQAGTWAHAHGVIDLGHCEHEGNKEDYQGIAHDLKAFDEITQFTETQYVYVCGWNRSADPNQRCRVLATGNPPSTAEGQWVIRRWGAWLDPTHPNPAKPGELRWYTTIEGEDTEVDADYVGPKGERPRSRSFIPSSLEDNPDLAETGYAATIEAMPEPLRTMLREGRFDVGQQDDLWQVIPADWIRQAQARWKSDGFKGLKMTAVAVDVAQGGPDKSSFASRYGTWFAELVRKKGIDTPDGPSIGAEVFKIRRDGAVVVVDLGGGYGGDAKRFLSDNGVSVAGFNGSHASTARTVDKALGFLNKRAETIWRFREALDPGQEGGSSIALPPDPMLVADLVAYRWKPVGAGNIQIESKEELRKRIGRSPDDGDATIMCWAEGEKQAIRKMHEAALGGRLPQVKVGYAQQKGRRR